MTLETIDRRQAMAGTAGLLGAMLAPASAVAAPASRALVVVGPSQHPPGTHEVAAGGRLLQHCLSTLSLKTDVATAWPKDGLKALDDVATIVFIGDMFPPEVMPNRDQVMADLAALMKRGCGLVCLHYATGLEAKHVAADGEHPLLHWMGGYFATRCKHHQSVARVFKEATVEPTTVDHPAVRGWGKFTIHDEPYINNYFGKDGPRKNVVALATAKLPPEKPEPHTVAWATERDDGGRGAGIVMPHFYRNWKNDDMRKLILGSILWTAKRDVPKEGAMVNLPDLASFKPAAVEPIAKKKG